MRRESQEDKEREGNCNGDSGQHAEQDYAKRRRDREAEFERMTVSQTERPENQMRPTPAKMSTAPSAQFGTLASGAVKTKAPQP